MEIKMKTGTANLGHKPGRKIEYIVLHYTAGSSSKLGTAVNTAAMFSRPGLNASADFIVDDEMIVQYNPDLNNYYTWAVGDGNTGNYGAVARNSNTISIEMCSTNTAWAATDMPNSPKWALSLDVVENALNLTRYLMEKFSIPLENVIRHYDISRKLCPGVIGWNPASGSEKEWEFFKHCLAENLSFKEEKEDANMTQEKFNSMLSNVNGLVTEDQFNKLMDGYIAELAARPASKREQAVMEKMQSLGLIKGDELGRFMAKKFMTRGEVMTVIDRLISKYENKDDGK